MEKGECPICFDTVSVEYTRPETCAHRFHRRCICEWAKQTRSCPLCRTSFNKIIVYRGDEVLDIQYFDTHGALELEAVGDPYATTVCRICRSGHSPDRLLLCDRCDQGFHTFCLTPVLNEIPQGQWFCSRCTTQEQVFVDLQQRLRQQRNSDYLDGEQSDQMEIEIGIRSERTREPSSSRRRRRVVWELESDDDLVNRGVQEGDMDSFITSDEGDLNDIRDFDEEVDHLGDIQLPSISRERGRRRRRTTSTSSGRRKIKRKGKKKLKKKRLRKVDGGSVRRKLGRRKKRRVVKRRVATNDEAGTSKEYVPMAAERQRLNVGGSGFMPVFCDDDENQPGPSSRFARSSSSSASASSNAIDENNCDLLGSIITEQVKTLAPGKLLRVKGDKFETSEEYESYANKISRNMSNDLLKRLQCGQDYKPRVSKVIRNGNIITNVVKRSDAERSNPPMISRNPMDSKWAPVKLEPCTLPKPPSYRPSTQSITKLNALGKQQPVYKAGFVIPKRSKPIVVKVEDSSPQRSPAVVDNVRELSTSRIEESPVVTNSTTVFDPAKVKMEVETPLAETSVHSQRISNAPRSAYDPTKVKEETLKHVDDEYRLKIQSANNITSSLGHVELGLLSGKTPNYEATHSKHIDKGMLINEIEKLAKAALKGPFTTRAINKEQYKIVMKAVVKSALKNRSSNEAMIKELVLEHLSKLKSSVS